MSRDFLESLLETVYWSAIGCIQDSDAVNAFARELHRLADCLLKDKRYKPRLTELGW